MKFQTWFNRRQSSAFCRPPPPWQGASLPLQGVAPKRSRREAAHFHAALVSLMFRFQVVVPTERAQPTRQKLVWALGNHPGRTKQHVVSIFINNERSGS